MREALSGRRGAERDLDPVDIALDRHLLVGVDRRRRVVHQPVAHQGHRRDLARHMLAGLEGNRRQIAQGVEIGEQRRRPLALLQRVKPLQAARHQPLVQDRQVVHLRDRHHEPAPGRLHQGLDLALVVALAGPAEAVAEQIMRLQVGEGLRAPTLAVAQDPRHRHPRPDACPGTESGADLEIAVPVGARLTRDRAVGMRGAIPVHLPARREQVVRVVTGWPARRDRNSLGGEGDEGVGSGSDSDFHLAAAGKGCDVDPLDEASREKKGVRSLTSARMGISYGTIEGGQAVPQSHSQVFGCPAG